jgi:hypothetical protein
MEISSLLTFTLELLFKLIKVLSKLILILIRFLFYLILIPFRLLLSLSVLLIKEIVRELVSFVFLILKLTTVAFCLYALAQAQPSLGSPSNLIISLLKYFEPYYPRAVDILFRIYTRYKFL